MMQKNSQNTKYDIFISYRREGGFETANILHDRLTSRGYRVFMDVENLRSGKFNEQLLTQIDSCKDVIVVLGPNSLERCFDENDWLRIEVAHALKMGKNVIPVFLRNFKYPSYPLPKDIEEFKNCQGVEASHELFSAFLNRLQSLLASKREFTWSRIKRHVYLLIIPIILIVVTVASIYLINYLKEKRQLEQVCKEVVTEVAYGYEIGNVLIDFILNTNEQWKALSYNLSKTNDKGKRTRLKNEMIKYIDHKVKFIDKNIKVPDIALIPAHQVLLSRHSISVEDIKAAKPYFVSQIREIREYFMKLREWLTIPENSWPDRLDEGIDYLTKFEVELINGGFYSFNYMLLEMPESVRNVYATFLPQFSNYTAVVDFNSNKNEIKAKVDKSYNFCKDYLDKYTMIITKK